LFIVAIKLCECRWQVQNKLTYETEIAQVDETSVSRKNFVNLNWKKKTIAVE
jgi:hypothetical protein